MYKRIVYDENFTSFDFKTWNKKFYANILVIKQMVTALSIKRKQNTRKLQIKKVKYKKKMFA